MENHIKFNQQQIITLRRQLADLEARRAQYENDVPPEIWLKLVEVSRSLEKAELEIRRDCEEIAGDVNQFRAEIISTLEQYNRWREQMRQIEVLFLANIVRPGRHLKQAIRQREYLQREHRRMSFAIQAEGYSSQQELEADIRRVLAHGDAAFDAGVEDQEEEYDEIEEPYERLDKFTVDDVVEAISREELVKEFKRVVLPRVHPDTSDTPAEIFKTVYEAYKKMDTLLMEAYIIEYVGEIQPQEETDPLESLGQVLETRDRYLRLSARLQRRVDRLKQDMTAQEEQDPKKIESDMQSQRQEILERIRSEAEKILYWRDKIEGLVQVFQEHHGQSEES